MLYDLRDKLGPIGRLNVLDDVAKKAKEYLDNLPKELVTASRLEQQASMLNNLGDVRVAQGKLQEAYRNIWRSPRLPPSKTRPMLSGRMLLLGADIVLQKF
jgi:hypothetical protein